MKWGRMRSRLSHILQFYDGDTSSKDTCYFLPESMAFAVSFYLGSDLDWVQIWFWIKNEALA